MFVCIYADTSTKPVLMSLMSIESTQIEEPPPYTAAMQYPVCLYEQQIPYTTKHSRGNYCSFRNFCSTVNVLH